MSNTNSDQTLLCSIYTQRQQTLQFTPPPPRYDPISPYPEHSQSQLNMRRKAEILQYKKNSTQTNSKLTKSQKWGQIVNGNFQQNKICPLDMYLPTPSSSCDVPGPTITLQFDPNIPLYNYENNTNALSILDKN
jgi:hypothetical protein